MQEKVNMLKESWYRCFQKQISRKLNVPRYFATEGELEERQKDYRQLILVFRRQMKELTKKYQLEKQVYFITDNKGLIIKILPKVFKKRIIEGVSFSEESCGTNAVSMAIESKQMIFLQEQEHYCDFLQNWSTLSVPLEIEKGKISFLSGLIFNKINDRDRIFFELLTSKIKYDLKQCVPISRKEKKTGRLSGVRKEILSLSAGGHTIREISEEINISSSAIKHHRRKICDKLKAKNYTNAIFRAVKYGLLDLEEVNAGSKV